MRWLWDGCAHMGCGFHWRSLHSKLELFGLEDRLLAREVDASFVPFITSSPQLSTPPVIFVLPDISVTETDVVCKWRCGSGVRDWIRSVKKSNSKLTRNTSRFFPKMFNMEKCKAAATPRQKLDDETCDTINSTQLLDREGCWMYRNGAGRAAYLFTDRPDISEAAKVLAQAMSKPRDWHAGLLKRLVRYLAESKRKATVYRKQAAKHAQLEVFVGSEWKGVV